MKTVGEVLMVAGAVLVLIASIGGLRYGNVYVRTHTASKVPLGLMLIAIGLGLIEQRADATVKLVLVVVLYMFTVPLGVHVLTRAIHLAGPPPVDVVDELAIDEAAPRDGGDVDVDHQPDDHE